MDRTLPAVEWAGFFDVHEINGDFSDGHQADAPHRSPI